jgi:hypothetical protein
MPRILNAPLLLQASIDIFKIKNFESITFLSSFLSYNKHLQEVQ